MARSFYVRDGLASTEFVPLTEDCHQPGFSGRLPFGDVQHCYKGFLRLCFFHKSNPQADTNLWDQLSPHTVGYLDLLLAQVAANEQTAQMGHVFSPDPGKSTNRNSPTVSPFLGYPLVI